MFARLGKLISAEHFVVKASKRDGVLVALDMPFAQEGRLDPIRFRCVHSSMTGILMPVKP
jgi:hypothetical protein